MANKVNYYWHKSTSTINREYVTITIGTSINVFVRMRVQVSRTRAQYTQASQIIQTLGDGAECKGAPNSPRNYI